MSDFMKKMRAGDGLLVVDVQNDFCPGGALPITAGDQVVPVLNRWLAAAAAAAGIPLYASRDFHPASHPSFAPQGGPWPIHCLQDSPGAAFHPGLQLPASTVIVTKGTRFDQDQNSAFDQTGLEQQLRRDGVRRLWVGGLALDVCVLATVLDARRAGFAVKLIRAGCRPVTAAGGEEALKKMQAAGAEVVEG
ncbi:nicotinamidase [Desulfuromonas carbonis]|uniref:isochorismatase family protein n=1 Tax=Desulfuromonas sp. DDH964 TaxID=1823759 RepID=UPI00078C5D3D|nr:isochorismatase family protein [Desulfuromonas sp. DDH964]AMV72876.1 nicotinamidase [Desulfuromonas sp. DDH964]